MTPEHNRILLVEDEAMIAMVQKRQLTSYGYQVTHVGSGEEALSILQSSEIPVDVVLMDIDLGRGLDGIETSNQILQFRDLPILFLSSHTEVEIVEKTEKVTSYGYVVKGSGITVLDASIKMADRLFQEKKKVAKHQESLEEAEKNFSEILQYSTESIVSLDQKYRIVTINDAAKIEYQQSFGIHLEIGQNFLDEIPESYRHLWKENIDLGFNGKQIQSDLEIVWNGKKHNSDVRLYPIYRNGVIARVGIFSRDITEKLEVLELARIQEEKYRNLFQNIAEEIHLWKVVRNKDGKIITWVLEDVNPVGLLAWNKTREETIGKQTGEIWPDANPVEQFIRIVNQIFADQTPFTWESYFPGTDQTLRMTSTPFGEYFFSIGQDVSIYRQTEAKLKKEIFEKEVLLKELHHRVKNNVANIEGFLDLQLQMIQNQEVKNALLTVISNVKAMRVLYDRMLVSQNFEQVLIKGYLSSLFEAFLELYNKTNGVTIRLELDDFPVKSNIAVPIGIIANELLTNAFKYAFESDSKSNQIRIALYTENGEGIFLVHDNGKGYERHHETLKKGFGISMVEMLAESIKGSFSISFANGTKCRLRFPLNA